MNSDLRAKRSSVFSDKTYSDEPIVRTASHMKNYEPPQYREMRKIQFYAYEKGWSSERVFYEQAKFMADFEDDYLFGGGFESYFPTYTAMSAEQLRGYFSWRTKVRHGELAAAPSAFGFVYIYELLNGIGVSNPDDGFFKLYNFCRNYKDRMPETERYAACWLMDYIAFYDLDVSLYGTYCDLTFENDLTVIVNCASAGGKELFDAVTALSGYNTEDSAFRQAHPREFAFAVCESLREYSRKYDKTHKTTFADKLFGRICAMPYTVFGSAVFYDRGKTADHTTALNENLAYTFSDGACFCRRCWGRRGKSGVLGGYVKYVDSILREVFGFGRPLTAVCPAKPFEKIVRSAARQAYDLSVAARESERRRYVDTSLLDGIMTASDKTREKLITEEELDSAPDVQNVTPAPDIGENDAGKTECDLPISAEEAGFLQCLLRGENACEYAKKLGKKISLLCDGINEKLYDLFFDNVICFEGDLPLLTEDYADDIANMLKGT